MASKQGFKANYNEDRVINRIDRKSGARETADPIADPGADHKYLSAGDATHTLTIVGAGRVIRRRAKPPTPEAVAN